MKDEVMVYDQEFKKKKGVNKNVNDNISLYDL